MASNSKIAGNLQITGALTMAELNIPAGTLKDVDVAAGAAIAASKIIHQFPVRYAQDDGSNIVAAIVPIHTVQGATATIKSVQAMIIDAPQGGDHEITVDLKKCYVGAGSTPVTVLTAPIVMNDADTADCEVEEAEIANDALTVGQTLVAVVSTTGSSGYGQGLLFTVMIQEVSA